MVATILFASIGHNMCKHCMVLFLFVDIYPHSWLPSDPFDLKGIRMQISI